MYKNNIENHFFFSFVVGYVHAINWKRKGCNTMLVVRQADDSFVCFGAKRDKGFWTRDLG